jgi:hypothetical protein
MTIVAHLSLIRVVLSGESFPEEEPHRDRGVLARGRTDLRTTEKAGIVFNPVESTFFESLDSEIRDLLRISSDATGTRYEVVDDSHGTRWVVLDDRDFEDRSPSSI